MEIRTFTGATLTEALDSLRAEFGGDAYVLATDQPESGPARVVAARAAPAAGGGPRDDARKPEATVAPPPPVEAAIDTLCRRHGVPSKLAEQLARADLPGRPLETTLPDMLGAVFEFAPIRLARAQRPILLVGPPGGGKTVTAAKLAAAARFGDRRAHLVSLDTWRAAGAEQLQRYASSLGVGCDVATKETPLARLAAHRALQDELLIIDTPGVVPFTAEDRDAVVEWVQAADAQVVLVLAAGLDPAEAGDLASAFTALGAERMIVPRIDATRRLGSVLQAAHSTGLAFAGVGLSPRVLGGYASLDRDLLARCLLSDDRSAAALLDDGLPAPAS